MRVYATGIEEEMYVLTVSPVAPAAPTAITLQRKDTTPFAINYEPTTQFQFVETDGAPSDFKLQSLPHLSYLISYRKTTNTEQD